MTTSPDVIVVGGGIGGLGAALALSRKGLSVRLLEKAKEFGEVGAGLQIASNCTRILAEYGLLDEIRARGFCPERMVMKDATDGSELTHLDLREVEKRYGGPYVVIHRSDLHDTLLQACKRAGVDLLTNQAVVGYDNTESASGGSGATVRLADGRVEEAAVVIAADGLHSVARPLVVTDEPVNSNYVAYRGAMPIEMVRDNFVSTDDVVVYVGPRCHFVQYPLRGGDMFNQVAVFESPKARAGVEDWGTPDELDTAFEGMCGQVRAGIPLMWRDRWWRMFDRDPIDNWLHGRIALLGDAAHPPLQYMAQGAIMALEDGWVLAEHWERTGDWDATLAAYNAVRPEHCRRVLSTGRAWGELWHLDGEPREQRNAVLRARAADDYSYVDWIYGPTALFPQDEAPLYRKVPLAQAAQEAAALSS